MALTKAITLPNGITLNYHVVTDIHHHIISPTPESIFEVHSYPNKAAFNTEQSALASGAAFDVYSHTWYFSQPLDTTKLQGEINKAEGLLKNSKTYKVETTSSKDPETGEEIIEEIPNPYLPQIDLSGAENS